MVTKNSLDLNCTEVLASQVEKQYLSSFWKLTSMDLKLPPEPPPATTPHQVKAAAGRVIKFQTISKGYESHSNQGDPRREFAGKPH